MRTGGGFGRRRPRTGGEGTDSVAEFFTPGQDGNLAWNTTSPIGDKPILLYVFNGHEQEGERYDYSKTVELGMFKGKDVIKAARAFTCEKICLDDHEFLRKVKGREPVHSYLAANMEKSEQRAVSIYFLDSHGSLISRFDEPKLVEAGAPALLKQMKLAKEENAKRLASLEANAEVAQGDGAGR